MPGWDDWTIEGGIAATGGDWPDIPDDLYEARIQDVSEPVTEPNKFKVAPTDPDMQTQFYVTFELLPTPQQIEDGCPEGATIRYYVTIPEMFLNPPHHLSSNSRLYKVMEVLGFNMKGPIRFNGGEWINLRCRVLTEHKNGKGEPTERARVSKVQEARKARPATTAPKRQPVGAGAAARPSLRQRLETDGGDTDDGEFE